jgi:hypothetical protein
MKKSLLIGLKCIVRTYSAGVWFGEIMEKSGSEVILKDARRLWSWKTNFGISLSAVAVYGIDRLESKVTTRVPLVWLEATEIIPASEVAIESISGCPEAKAQKYV